jgi:hypothetical protein
MQIPQAAREISEQHSCQAALHGCLPAETAPALPEQCSGAFRWPLFRAIGKWRIQIRRYRTRGSKPVALHAFRAALFALRFSRSRNPFCFQTF